MAILFSLFSILVFLLILSILVIIHELGHFLVAKRLGIKVEEFGFGFPPRVWGKKVGETLYSINLLPIGGFVKLYGEDEAGGGRIPAKVQKLPTGNLKRAFFARPVWQRAAVVVAGVVMNTLLAVVIFYLFLLISGFRTEIPLITDYRFQLANQQNMVNALIVDVASDSPASKAGLKPCTQEYCARVTSVNGQAISGRDAFLNTIKQNAGREVTLAWEDIVSKKDYSARITPRENPPEGQGALGVAFDVREFAEVSYDTPVQKVFSGFIHPYNLMVYQVEVLGRFVSDAFERQSVQPVSDAVAGPIGIAVLTDRILDFSEIRERVLGTLELAGILSLSLAFFNILPIPALDGGRLFFILFEGVTRRKVNQRFETIVHTVGMAVLMGLIAVIFIKEINQYILPAIAGFFGLT